jgi:hypothetical protein
LAAGNKSPLASAAFTGSSDAVLHCEASPAPPHWAEETPCCWQVPLRPAALLGMPAARDISNRLSQVTSSGGFWVCNPSDKTLVPGHIFLRACQSPLWGLGRSQLALRAGGERQASLGVEAWAAWTSGSRPAVPGTL